jgi:hypothetical protein
LTPPDNDFGEAPAAFFSKFWIPEEPAVDTVFCLALGGGA